MTGVKEFTLALCQLKVTEDLEFNLAKAALFVERAKASNADLVLLPEMFACPYEDQWFTALAEVEGGPVYQALKHMSQGILLVGGSHPEKEGNNLYNTCYSFEDGVLLGKYRKINLFNVQYDGMTYHESATLSPGEECCILHSRLGVIALAICFDLRFPALFQELEKANPFLYLLPAAFNQVSGPLHYKLLGQARALDQESYLALCSPAGNPESSYKPYGHSMVIDPWGEVLTELGDEEGIALQTITLDRVNEIRTKLPLKKPLI